MNRLLNEQFLHEEIRSTINRKEELQFLKTAIIDKGKSLVIIVGQPGMGKTTVAKLFANETENISREESILFLVPRLFRYLKQF